MAMRKLTAPTNFVDRPRAAATTDATKPDANTTVSIAQTDMTRWCQGGVAHCYLRTVASWRDLEEAEPEFASRVRRMFDAGRHKTIATLRADGSPRISGIECEIVDGELRFGSMTGSRKGADLERDPRFALHGPTAHPLEGHEDEWPGEAKIAGRAVLAPPDDGGSGPDDPVSNDDVPDGLTFVADMSEVVITALDEAATMLVIETWTPERGLRRIERP